MIKGVDVEFESASQVDPFGRVFRYAGGIYRAIHRGQENAARTLVGKCRNWEAYGMVETDIADISLDDYALVLRHREIAVRSYCEEWTPGMLRDAALMYLGLQVRLVDDGYVLKDGHPWNILFDGGRPVYVDVGSIVPYERETLRHALEEFRLYFLLPLYMFARHGTAKTYSFLGQRIPNPEERKKQARYLGVLPIRLGSWPGARIYLKWLAWRVRQLRYPALVPTEWTGYEQKAPEVRATEQFDAKQRSVSQVLRDHPAKTLLDIGCNKGWYSLLAVALGYEVVAIDVDVPSLELLYRMSSRERLPILSLVVDICAPTGANGQNGAYPGFTNRVSADYVLAMSVIHHLSYRKGMHFDVFAERIARLTTRAAIVEFIPADDVHVSRWDQAGMEWYSRDSFVEAFSRYFSRYENFPSSPSPRETFVFWREGS